MAQVSWVASWPLTLRIMSASRDKMQLVVQAELVSHTSFALIVSGPRSAAQHQHLLHELAAAGGANASQLVRQLSEGDSCELSAAHYLQLHSALVAAGRATPGGPFVWCGLPAWLINGLPSFRQEQHMAGQVVRSLWLPEGLMPYQQEGVRRGIMLGGRVLLADEMGLGKTAQALGIVAQYLDSEGPALVVAPSSLGGLWKDQALRWLPHNLCPEEVQVINGAAERPMARSRIVIVSYVTFTKNSKAYSCTAKGLPWQLVVCDEAHYLRNPESQRTRLLLPILQGASRAVLITGTPTPRHAVEAFALVHALNPLGCEFKEWCDRYGTSKTKCRDNEIAALLQEVMVRRCKAEVLDQLPPKHRQRIMLQPTGFAAALKKLQKDASAEGSPISDDKYFQELARVKQAAVLDYVEYLLDASERKFLLFAHHRVMMIALEKAVTERGVSCIRIDGSTPPMDRPALVRQFQTQSGCRVAILSILAAGEGLTLTAASLCVFCELCPAVPGVIEQAEGRLHRIGQADTVDVHFLVVNGTRDDAVFTRLEARSQSVTRIVGNVGEASELQREESADIGSDALCPDMPASKVPARRHTKRTKVDEDDDIPLQALSSIQQRPKRSRRKPGFDLGSVLDREINEAQSHIQVVSTPLGGSYVKDRALGHVAGGTNRIATAVCLPPTGVIMDTTQPFQGLCSAAVAPVTPTSMTDLGDLAVRPCCQSGVLATNRRGNISRPRSGSDSDDLPLFCGLLAPPPVPPRGTLGVGLG